MGWPNDIFAYLAAFLLGISAFLVIRVLWLAGSVLDQILKNGRRR